MKKAFKGGVYSYRKEFAHGEQILSFKITPELKREAIHKNDRVAFLESVPRLP